MSQVDLRPAAQYLRMSTSAQKYSLANQALQIAAWAEPKGFRVVSTYSDAGRSGVTAKGREGLARLLSDVITGRAEFSTVLVLDATRWGRFQDLDEAGHYEFVCRSAGVEVLYCLEQEEDGISGLLAKQVRRVAAAQYSEDLSRKVRAGKLRSVEAGRAPGAWPRYGFRRQVIDADGHPGRVLARGEMRSHPSQGLRLVPDRTEARVVRRIFRLFLVARMPPVRIAATLNAARVPWADGTPWTGRRVIAILRCELVTGQQVFGRTTSTLDRPRCLHGPADWRRVRVFSPVVSCRTFRAAMERLRELDGRPRTDGDLLADLSALLQRHGRLSAALIQTDSSLAAVSVYEKRFGTLGAAYASVGYRVPRRGTGPDGIELSREDILDGLRRLYAEKGRLSWSLVCADRRLPSRHIMRKQFGTLALACTAAGIQTDVTASPS